MEGRKPMRLESKMGIVTGASRGIGRAIALALARDGADVAVNYLVADTLAAETVAAI
jgi:3-oxoacyl-[acyl-carrier protein] reductase